MTAWTRRSTRGKGSVFVGEWVVGRGLTLSARAVDEDADLQRFVAVEVVEESLAARIGTRFGVFTSVVCGVMAMMMGRQKGVITARPAQRTFEDDDVDNWFRRRVCSVSMRRNWSFHDLISPRRVSSRRRHWSFHCWASWRSCEISSAWCLFCV
jgi:hypothetical protein